MQELWGDPGVEQPPPSAAAVSIQESEEGEEVALSPKKQPTPPTRLRFWFILLLRRSHDGPVGASRRMTIDYYYG